MSDPARFLTGLAQALAAMGLYRPGHPARERAVEAAYRELVDLQAATRRPSFTFLGEETVFGQLPLREMKTWDWGRRLAEAGIQRLEFEERVERDEFEQFLDEVLARLTLQAISTAEARQLKRAGIKFGSVGLKGEAEAPAPLPTATLTLTLNEEAETLRWLQQHVQAHGAIPLLEAETIVRSLAVAMHGDHQMVLPLLRLKEFDQYTTTHSLNVSVLAMALAEFLGVGSREVRAFGVAGLLHDIGKIRIPIEILTKPGKFSTEERAIMNRHPAEGARIILETDAPLNLAAVVAYEHHVMLDGGGYPTFRFRRECHAASKLVHVCDVYDALRTHRPYRDAWPSERALEYLAARAGTEFDPTFATGFVRMMSEWESRVALLSEGDAPPAVPSPR
jgi:putative nucleotidyltransferase with HDIG domain